MATLTRSGMRTHAKLRAQDPDTTNPGISDANWNLLLDEAYHDWFMAFADRLKLVDPFATIANNGYTATSAASPYTVESIELKGSASWAGGPHVPLELDDYDAVRADIADAYAIHGATVGSIVDDTPRRVGIRKTQDATTYDVVVYPGNATGGNLVLQAWCRNELTALSGDSSTPDCYETDAYNIALLAAARGSALMGNDPGFTQGLWQELPQKWQDRFGRISQSVKPRAVPGEALT